MFHHSFVLTIYTIGSQSAARGPMATRITVRIITGPWRYSQYGCSQRTESRTEKVVRSTILQHVQWPWHWLPWEQPLISLGHLFKVRLQRSKYTVVMLKVMWPLVKRNFSNASFQLGVKTGVERRPAWWQVRLVAQRANGLTPHVPYGAKGGHQVQTLNSPTSRKNMVYSLLFKIPLLQSAESQRPSVCESTWIRDALQLNNIGFYGEEMEPLLYMLH